MERPIRVLITDDHAIVREGLRAVIESKPDMEIVGEAENGAQAVPLALEQRPDVILMDLLMPVKSGIEAINEIRRQNPEARILVLTSYADNEQVFSAIRAGALGYLLKESSPQELIEAIRCVHRGEPSLHPAVARKLILGFAQETKSDPETIALTDRELEVLKLVARGLTNPEIAASLSVGEGTVRFHVSNILTKLQLENRTQAVLYALRKGMVSLNG